MTLKWLPASDNVGVTSYKIVARLAGAAAKTYTTTNTTANAEGFVTYNADGLTSNSGYTFEVKAIDAAGNQSDAITATADTSAASLSWPKDASLTVSNLETTSLTLTWPQVSNPADLSSYVIYVNGTEEDTVPASQTYYDLGGLDPGQEYTLGVRAVNADGIANTMLQTLTVTEGGGGLAFTLTPFAGRYGRKRILSQLYF